jgi:DNA-binding HxlR family transcriptional regulator
MPKQADTRVQRLVVLQVLKRECGVAAQTEIEEALSDIEPAVIEGALHALENEDIIMVEGGRVTATICTLHLDRLGLISL